MCCYPDNLYKGKPLVVPPYPPIPDLSQKGYNDMLSSFERC
jgi:hypothetical protein